MGGEISPPYIPHLQLLSAPATKADESFVVNYWKAQAIADLGNTPSKFKVEFSATPTQRRLIVDNGHD